MKCCERGCDRQATKRGLCGKHYLRVRRSNRLSEYAPMFRGRRPWRSVKRKNKRDKTVCAITDCSSKAFARGLCRNCYIRLRRRKLIETNGLAAQVARNSALCCRIEGCTNKPKHDGLCSSHYHRKWRYGDPTFLPQWTRNKGKPRTDARGYRVFHKPGHPLARRNGYVFEHRLVMSEVVGRLLTPEETVHHKNGKRADNSPTNLELWTSSHPPGQRVQDIVAWAKEILERYPSTILDRLK